MSSSSRPPPLHTLIRGGLLLQNLTTAADNALLPPPLLPTGMKAHAPATAAHACCYRPRALPYRQSVKVMLLGTFTPKSRPGLDDTE